MEINKNQNGGDRETSFVASMSKKLFSVSELSSNCCIYKVPRVLRKINEESYTPQLISIGPFHRGEPRLKAMEEHKWRYLRDFLNRPPKNDMNYYVQNLKSFEAKVRKCYGEVIELKSEEGFVEMMLLDGCFIIELTLKFCMADLRHTDDPIFNTGWMLNAIRLDMALLENQLPFFVLDHLFNLINGPDRRYGVSSLIELTIRFSKYDVLGQKVSHNKSGEVKHLVHLLRKCHGPSVKRMIPRSKKRIQFIPSATELRDAGVKFIRSEGHSSFLDVQFTVGIYKGAFKGVFEIPSITVDSGSEIIIRNIIAFEHFDLRPNYISHYITLMDSLINTAEDVAFLRRCGIINNWLSDNEEVASLFNKLRNGAFVEDESFYYARLFEDVNAYYKLRWPRWQAKLKRNYFNTPWSFLSFFGAIILLVCTTAQTVYTIFFQNN